MLAQVSIAAAAPSVLQNPALVSRMLAAVNAARIANGLPPYALNTLLTLSAQGHSEYQAATGLVTHDSPDGSRSLARALAVGYPTTWVNENIYAGAGAEPEEAVHWWLTADEAHRNNVLHPVLREVGVGIALGSNGMVFYTLDISAQPNVLPIFINNDASTTNSANVTLTLANENIFVGAAGQIGLATQIMISNSPDFADAATRPWAQYIDWTLDTSGGAEIKTVYVRFIDAGGRTADSNDIIFYDPGGVEVPLPTPLLSTLPPLPSASPTTISLPLPTPLDPTTTPSVTPTPDAEIDTPPPAPTSTQTLSPKTSPTPNGTPKVEKEAIKILGVAVQTLRSILLGTLALGLGAILLGAIALIRAIPHKKRDKNDG